LAASYELGLKHDGLICMLKMTLLTAQIGSCLFLQKRNANQDCNYGLLARRASIYSNQNEFISERLSERALMF